MSTGHRETSAEIDQAATAWVARLDRGPLTPEEDAALDEWLLGDTRRVGAFGRAQAVMLHLDRAKALGSTYNPDDFTAAPPSPPPKPRPAAMSRRAAVTGAGALAASIAAAVGFGLQSRLATTTVATRRGEIRLVPLDDGSVVTLNTASKIVVNYGRGRRDVRLVAGEALFDVAKDAERPFRVSTGDMTVRAVGTSFTVRKIGETPTEVMVREGIVEVNRPDDGAVAIPPVRLAANQRVAASMDQPLQAAPISTGDLDRELAWRQGMLSFSGTRLGEAATQFERYSDPKIVIDDGEVASETITGLFSANDPQGFAQAVAVSLNLEAYTRGDEIHLRR